MGGRNNIPFRHSDVERFAMGMLGGEDNATVIDSGSDSDGERDYTRGLAQRATEPYYKQIKAKGPFVVSNGSLCVCSSCSHAACNHVNDMIFDVLQYVKQANKPGHNFYIKEEMERIKLERDQQRLQELLRCEFYNYR